MFTKVKKILVVYIFIGFFLNLFATVYGKDSEKILFRNIQEKRSVIQVVDGFAYLSENMTLAETREAAFINAKRQALEMTKTFIQSKTKVENLELVYDHIDVTSEGAVTVIEQKDFGVESNSRYHVWIKAEVEYGLRTQDNIKTTDSHMNESSPLTVKIWTSKDIYREGERIEIYIKGNKDFYARVINISSDGNIIQLLPNKFRKNNLFKAGNTYVIPDKTDKFDLKVTPPFGIDQLVIYASDVPLGSVHMENVDNGLHKYRGTIKSFGMKTRGIKIAPTDNESELVADFYEAICTITTTN